MALVFSSVVNVLFDEASISARRTSIRWRKFSMLASKPNMAFQRASRSCHFAWEIFDSEGIFGATAWGGCFKRTYKLEWEASFRGGGRGCLSSGLDPSMLLCETSPIRNDSTSS